MAVWNCVRIAARESWGPHDAMPSIARGKSEVRNRDSGVWDSGGGWEGYARCRYPLASWWLGINRAAFVGSISGAHGEGEETHISHL